MFDAAKAIIFACVKFGVYFGGLYYLLALGYGSKRNEDMIKINERAICDLALPMALKSAQRPKGRTKMNKTAQTPQN